MTGLRRRPVLVTGLPRSGTSWVGKMLQLSGEVVYVNEPMNPSHPPGRSPGVLRADVGGAFEYIRPDDDRLWSKAFEDTIRLRYHPLAELRRNHAAYDLARLGKYQAEFLLGRIRGRRCLLDDPYATFSVSWFAEALGADVVLLVRDPASLAGSWRQLGWTARAQDILRQPALVDALPAGAVQALRDSQRSQNAQSPDPLQQVAALWRAAYEQAVDVAAASGGRIRLQTYESLAAEPEACFETLYQHCGLTWSATTAEGVRQATLPSRGADRPDRGFSWSLRSGLARTAFQAKDSRAALAEQQRRLSPEEAERVRAFAGPAYQRIFGPGHDS